MHRAVYDIDGSASMPSVLKEDADLWVESWSFEMAFTDNCANIGNTNCCWKYGQDKSFTGYTSGHVHTNVMHLLEVEQAPTFELIRRETPFQRPRSETSSAAVTRIPRIDDFHPYSLPNDLDSVIRCGSACKHASIPAIAMRGMVSHVAGAKQVEGTASTQHYIQASRGPSSTWKSISHFRLH